MKGGITIRHATLRNVVALVPTLRRLREPHQCPTCQVAHETKTYHLTLDYKGEVTVSETVYERLREMPDLPFTTVGHEPNPEPQRIVIAAPLVAAKGGA